MRAKVVVEKPEDFRQWVGEQKQETPKEYLEAIDAGNAEEELEPVGAGGA